MGQGLTFSMTDESSLPRYAQNHSAMTLRYRFISNPYALSHGPAMFFIPGCHSPATASHVFRSITGPICAMTDSDGR